MPTYEYECKRCRNRFEVFQRMTDEPKGLCPKCGGDGERLIGTGGGIIFKGPGFYATDYRKKKGPDDKKACPEGKPDACKNCPSNPE